MPRSTEARWAVPSVTAASTSPVATALARAACCSAACVDDASHLLLVGVARQHRFEVLGAEQPGQHLAVHLDEQRVAARSGDQRVERLVELAELGQLHLAAEAGGEGVDLGAFVAARPFGGEVDDRQLEELGASRTTGARTSLRSSSWSTLTSGRCSTTYERLPRRSMTPSDSSPWIASRTDVRATRNCSERSRSEGIASAGLEIADDDAFEELIADLRAQRLARRSVRTGREGRGCQSSSSSCQCSGGGGSDGQLVWPRSGFRDVSHSVSDGTGPTTAWSPVPPYRTDGLTIGLRPPTSRPHDVSEHA